MDVLIPDIGDFEEVDVIEILVSVGDEISIETPLMTLESDKATMDIPSPASGRVRKISVSVGDKVSKGDKTFEIEEFSITENVTGQKEPAIIPEEATDSVSHPKSIETTEIRVPDIGDFDEVDIIEILVTNILDIRQEKKKIIEAEGLIGNSKKWKEDEILISKKKLITLEVQKKNKRIFLVND